MARQLTPQQKHKREVRNQIILPFLLVVILFVALMVLTLFLVSPWNDLRGLSLMADMAVSVMCLLPQVILCLVPYVIMVALAAGVWQGTNASTRFLRRTRARISSFEARIQQNAPRVAGPVIGLQARIAYLERLANGLAGSRPDKNNDNPANASPEKEQTQ